jgi:hypothetical protein
MHVDYLTAYQAKLKEIGEQQMKAAEGTYSEVSKSFSEAITLQQLLFFNYRDAARAGTQGNDDALEAKNARAIYLKYDELRTNLRENIDPLSRAAWRSTSIGRVAGLDAPVLKWPQVFHCCPPAPVANSYRIVNIMCVFFHCSS